MARLRSAGVTLALLLGLVSAAVISAQAQTYDVLYSFVGEPDGATAYAGVIRDGKGNLYGTTNLGGVYGYGTVFKLDKSGNETVLYSFQGYPGDGANPYAGLVRDAAGNLYGTTSNGGAYGYGTVFKVSSNGIETALHNFTGGADGCYPYGSLLRKASNLYGAASMCGSSNWGVVFKLTKTGAETVLYSFTDGADGGAPVAGLILDKAGNLYGTTAEGGSSRCSALGCGVVFELSKTGAETVLHAFCAKSACLDGGNPQSPLIQDAEGNLYGTTANRGAYGGGTVFKVDTSAAFTVLYSFEGGSDGWSPFAGLVRDADGNLYGTTLSGGTGTGCLGSSCGVVFKLDAQDTETILYRFEGGNDGGRPYAGVIRDGKNLYGTTTLDGAFGNGTVFKLTP